MTRALSNEALAAARAAVIPKGHASGTACYVAHASGALVVDVAGREYIDFAGGIAVMNVGHSHPKVVEAIRDQAGRFTHTCFMVLPYEPAVRLAERLCPLVPGEFPKRALLVNSGAEAVENAVKIARYHTRRPAVIAFDNGYHGRTLLTMTLTSKVNPYKLGFGPFAPEIYHAPFAYCYRCPLGLTHPSCALACADHLEDFICSCTAPEQTAAVIAEPIQGEGGFITPPAGYFERVAAVCRKHGILFIADEIQTGIGRTGRMFALEHYGVAADLTTVAKSLASGMPLAAVVGRDEVMESVHPGGLGGTYGANPVSCAAALAVLDIIAEEDVLGQAQRLGERLSARLAGFKERFEIVGDVRGIGPMLAMELVKDRHTKEPAPDQAKALGRFCFEKGLVILTCGRYGNVVRLLMPLVITGELLERGLAILEEGLATVRP